MAEVLPPQIENKTSFSEAEAELAWWIIFDSPSWDGDQIEKTARGMANGICHTDSWPVKLKSWLELTRLSAGLNFEEIQHEYWKAIQGKNSSLLRSWSLPTLEGGKDDVLFYCRQANPGR